MPEIMGIKYNLIELSTADCRKLNGFIYSQKGCPFTSCRGCIETLGDKDLDECPCFSMRRLGIRDYLGILTEIAVNLLEYNGFECLLPCMQIWTIAEETRGKFTR